MSDAQQRDTPKSPRSGAQALVGSLLQAGVTTVFGLPGVHNLAAWEAIEDSSLRLVGVRHEQATVYAADATFRATGKVGVAITTTGPGAANTLGAVGEAWAAGSAVVIIATDIPTTLRRPGTYRGVLHECDDQAGMFAPVVKQTIRAGSADEIGAAISTAIAAALTPPSGPVYVEIPTDLLDHESTAPVPTVAVAEPAAADADAVARAASLLATAERPLIWAGGGAVRSGAGPALIEIAERTGAPVLETFMARGLTPRDHPCRVGMAPHLPEAGELWDAADLVLAVGTDFDGMMTQNWRMPRPQRLISINVEAKDAVKAYAADIALIGDAAATCAALAERLERTGAAVDLAAIGARLTARRQDARTRLAATEPDAVGFLESLEQVLPERAKVIADMCIPGYWIAGLLDLAVPRRLAYPVGWGTLGFAFPAGLGAALADGEKTLAVCGDGGFLFATGEMATLKQEGIDLTLLIVDDGGYGMLRFDQDRSGRAHTGTDLESPDFEALSRAFGLPVRAVDGVGEPLRQALTESLAEDGPSVVVCRASLDPPETTSARWPRA